MNINIERLELTIELPEMPTRRIDIDAIEINIPKNTDATPYSQTCLQCRADKPCKHFKSQTAGAPYTICKECRALLREKLYEEQNGVCAICANPSIGKALALDHSHETGHCRSLLCGQCNAAIGTFKDNPDLMRRAAEYIEQHTLKDK